VVAIANHVAAMTGSVLGQEVGFRIGQKSIASKRTTSMFTTSGLLLEELRANVRTGYLALCGKLRGDTGYIREDHVWGSGLEAQGDSCLLDGRSAVLAPCCCGLHPAALTACVEH